MLGAIVGDVIGSPFAYNSWGDGSASDTIACIAGAIAHAYYGGIPKNLIDPVLGIYMSPDLAEMSLSFCTRFNVPV